MKTNENQPQTVRLRSCMQRLLAMCLLFLLCLVPVALFELSTDILYFPMPHQSEAMAILIETIGFLGFVSIIPLEFMILLIPVFLAALSVLWLMRLSGLAHPRALRVCWIGLFLCLLTPATEYSCGHAIGPAVKEHACYWLADYQRPLIDALEAYRTEHGSYPETLDALTPQYLNRPPMAGLAGFTEFEYSSSGADFDLEIPCGSPLNMDDSSYFGYNRDGFWELR